MSSSWHLSLQQRDTLFSRQPGPQFVSFGLLANVTLAKSPKETNCGPVGLR